MFEFLVRRAFVSGITLVIISLVVFTGVRMIPGDPARVLGGTDADPAGLEHRGRVLHPGEDEDPDRRALFLEAPGYLESVDARKAHVQDEHVRLQPRARVERRVAVAGLPHHLDPGVLLTRHPDGVPEQRVVVHDHHPDRLGPRHLAEGRDQPKRRPRIGQLTCPTRIPHLAPP